ncbi:MAG: UDP-2,3-diacylglucosamine diphosphatase [Gemmatimonadetes bacterium]|nr:UDP-2,3-diacylglucosamine diphosphatase [Gemmatimonadota bacterium]MYD26945.1 UDP-2,3-diacylglucosamine diphosphatase [Gemmatimonadota bacterium]
MSQDPVYFISDAHLGIDDYEAEEERRNRLLDFLRSLRGGTPLLYIVGDLFDFWFEYRSVVPRQHYTVLHALSSLVENGTRVVYLPGNHDFWLGTFLNEQVGVETAEGPLTATHHGRRIYVAHGHGLITRDRGYRAVSKIMHSAISIRLFQLIHPDCGFKIGRLISRMSRRHGSPTDWDPREAYRDLAFDLLDEGYDAVVFGHIHSPTLQYRGEKAYINLGDWIRHGTYGVLREGEMFLEKYGDEEQPAE